MSELRRYLEKSAVYFVTTVVANRKKIFTDVNSARFLLFCIGYHKFLLEFNLFGYVIMPERLHLLLQPTSEKNNLSWIMKLIKGNFARKYNELHCQKGKVWQDRFYDTGLRDEQEILKWLEYMHFNPVKSGLVNHPSEYEFSSYHQYYGKRRQSVQVPIDPIL